MNRDKQLRNMCSECFKAHGFRCVAISCYLGIRQSMKDYRMEYRLFHRVTRTDNLVIIQNRQFVNLKDHKHELAFTVAYPLKDGFVIKKSVCSICRETYEQSIYRDYSEFERLNAKLGGY